MISIIQQLNFYTCNIFFSTPVTMRSGRDQINWGPVKKNNPALLLCKYQVAAAYVWILFLVPHVSFYAGGIGSIWYLSGIVMGMCMSNMKPEFKVLARPGWSVCDRND